jgi:Na+-transporting NADH:ubiquinone oxidoreductase subunit NqrA
MRKMNFVHTRATNSYRIYVGTSLSRFGLEKLFVQNTGNFSETRSVKDTEIYRELLTLFGTPSNICRDMMTTSTMAIKHPEHRHRGFT